MCVTANPPSKPSRSGDRLALDEAAVAEPDRLVLHAERANRQRDRDHRRAALAGHVLVARRDRLVGRMQVVPRLGVVVVDDLVRAPSRPPASDRPSACRSEEPQPAIASAAIAASRVPHARSIRSSPSSTETASVSLHEPLAVVLDQIRVREPQLDAVGDREPAVAAEHVHLVHAVEQLRLEHQLVVERRSRVRPLRRRRSRPPSLRGRRARPAPPRARARGRPPGTVRRRAPRTRRARAARAPRRASRRASARAPAGSA